jgi:hypothetical protein
VAALIDVVNELRTGLTALGYGSQLSSDTRDDLDNVTQAGTTRYQIQHQNQQEAEGGNVFYPTGAIICRSIHLLSDFTDERAYTEGAMLTQQANLLRRQWWRDNVASVREVSSGPEIEDNVERIGNIVIWSFLITFVIVP